MPHSSHLPMTLMMEHVVRIKPARVMDIGAGYGKWGFLVREALDFMEGNVDRSSWKAVIHGIDAFPYVSPLLDWVYDRVDHANAVESAGAITGYDLVILGDVIEHFTKSQGIEFIETLLRTNRHVLITTPVHFFQQEIADNPFERHLSHWQLSDFRPWRYDLDVVSDTALVVLLAGAGASYPDRMVTVASRLVYSLPRSVPKGAGAKFLKSAVLRMLRAV